MTRDRWRQWAFAALLYLPVALFYIAHYSVPHQEPGLLPTGFIQYDQPYYMANARQYVDGSTDGLRYASPFSAQVDPDAIYFQPQTALLGWLWKITGADPGVLFVLFGVVFGLLCVRSCLRLLEHVLPSNTSWRSLIAVLFLWGGGLLFLVGYGYGLIQGEGIRIGFLGGFRFDPAGGWWFLNLGRNLIYPLEAYYHFLFFTMVLALLRKRFVLATVVAALLALSHPFTGVAALLMILVWAALERWYFRSRELPRWFPLALAATLALTLVYYGPVLMSEPEHKILMAQWKIAWTENAITFVPAYVLVGLLAFGRLRSPQRTIGFLRSPIHRLLAVWVITWFALENHEFAMTPVQPVHFTRGYTWSALFLIGVPFLSKGLTWLRERLGSAIAGAAIGVFTLFFVLDNAVWMAIQTRTNAHAEGAGIHLTLDQRELFTWLAKNAPANSLLVANDPMNAYLALVYTPHRAYYSHNYNTPYARQRYPALGDYFNGRITDPLLKQPLLAVVYEGNGPFVFADRGERIYMSGSYAVYRMPAIP